MKTCRKCSKVKPLNEFHRGARNKDGLQYRCKVCVAAYQVEYRRVNQDKDLARKAEYFRANRDKARAQRIERHQASPHVYWEYGYRQRCRQFGLTPVIVSFTREDVVTQHGESCFYCETGSFEQLDHHIPIAAGGFHTLENVRPSCAKCNSRKSATADRQLIAEARSA